MANSVNVFSVARFAGGLAIGLASALTPVYIAEIAPSKNRGVLVSLNQLAIVVGILSAYLINWQLAKLGDASWRWMLAVAAVPSIVFLLACSSFLKARAGLSPAAAKTKANASSPASSAAEAKIQVADIEHAVKGEAGSWAEVFEPDMRKRLGVAIALAIFSQVTGINTVLYYGSIIISEHFKGQSTSTALAANVLIGGVNLVFTLVAMAFLDRIGRRAILMIASGGMGISLAALVICLSLPAVSPIAMLSCIMFYVASFAFGMGPGVWLYMSEIFPTKVRGRAAALTTSTLWAGTLVVTFTFLSLVKTLGIGGTFAIYAALCFVCLIYVWRIVPETRGRTLEQIQ